MFDRFTENAQQTMLLARTAAARHGGDHLDVEHLLIGVLEVRRSSANAQLEALGVDVDSLLSALETMLPKGDAGDPARELPFAPGAKRVLQAALSEAARRNHTHVGSLHIVLGILLDEHNDAAAVLRRVGVNPEDLSQAMTDSIPKSRRSLAQLLLVSNSTMHGGGYLQHCKAEIDIFLGAKKRVLFVPFALADHQGYADKARPSFEAMGHELISVHTFSDMPKAVAEADAVFVGGGNTFRLLATMYHHGLIDAIRARVFDGMPYMGSSAGTNVATQSIRTTNDMPIVQPPTFTALQLVPFQINPHYLDPDPGSSHMGETREERINQFHEEHEGPVLGLREGCMLRVDGERMELRGTTNARLFRRDQTPEEFAPPSDLSFLLAD